MKIIFQDLAKGEVKVEVQTLDDLWYLSQCIEKGDNIQGKTVRKIKLGDDTEKNVKIIKKQVLLKIQVEKKEFQKFSNVLRVLGKVKEGPEDIPHGAYHTIEIEEGTIVKILKNKWPKYLLEKIRAACEEKKSKILIVALDRDQVTYALLTASGYKILAEQEGEVEKKGYGETKEKEFYQEITKHVEEYERRYAAEHIILASPAFWKEDLLQIVKKKYPKTAAKVIFATCNTTGRNAIEEVLKREEVKAVLKNDRTVKETTYVEDVLKEIAKNGLAIYGEREVQEAAKAHAIKILLVADTYLQEQREQEKEKQIDALMHTVEQSQGEVHIIASDHDAGKKICGLGGLAAILRYRLK